MLSWSNITVKNTGDKNYRVINWKILFLQCTIDPKEKHCYATWYFEHERWKCLLIIRWTEWLKDIWFQTIDFFSLKKTRFYTIHKLICQLHSTFYHYPILCLFRTPRCFSSNRLCGEIFKWFKVLNEFSPLRCWDLFLQWFQWETFYRICHFKHSSIIK